MEAMAISYLEFREALYPQGLFSFAQVKLHYPDFNANNLLYWQKKGYIVRLRREWYCFREFTQVREFTFLVANNIYSPSYISHQEALLFYGLIPEHIVNSTSITTKKTRSFEILGKTFKYYSIHPMLFFGYELKEMTANGFRRNVHMADREKAILDLLYIFDFYRTEEDLSEIRFNEIALEKDIDWQRMEGYLQRFGLKVLDRKIQTIRKIYQV
jgi:predicted transcriptional regulator of viral defense system